MSEGSDLVKRRVARTRAEIIESAITLFVERGFDNTSMAQIAAASGVARRTLYRYFPTKEDIVFESPREWLQVFNEIVATRREGEPTRDLFIRALGGVVAYIDERADRVRTEFSILAGSTSLHARHGRSDAEWVDRYLELLRPDVEHQPGGELTATVCAMSLVAAQNAIITVWATGLHGADLSILAGAAFSQVDGIWPAASR